MSRRAPIEVIGTANLVYTSRHGRLYDDNVLGPDGRAGTFLRWEWSTSGVVVVPTDGKRLYLWPMYRYPVGRVSLEFPRGAAGRGEAETDAAVRELAEETGFRAVQATMIGTVHADTGFITGSSAIVLANVDAGQADAPQPEATEAITGPPLALSVTELIELVRQDRITCALTITAFLHAIPYLGGER